MSSAGMDSPATQRRVVTAAQMDAVGRFDKDDQDDDVEQQQSTDKRSSSVPSSSPRATASNKTKQTPPPSPPLPLNPSSSTTSSSSIGGLVVEEDSSKNGKKDAAKEAGRSVVSNMEIGQSEDEDDEDHDLDEFDADLERLLGDTGGNTARSTLTPRRRCCSYYKIGNTTVVCPRIYQRTQWLGVIGPHWFGPLCTLGLVLWGSHHFIKISAKIGPVTQGVCIAFTILTVTSLVGVSCGDPGIVRESKPRQQNLENWRWCDFCNVYQPPDGAHCPDCKVCVEGYDHHCVWMGTCVGRKNMKAFKVFNLSWLFYLIYCIVWVTIVGPNMFHHAKQQP